jgi:antitoxin (DNA-binding transcriptional repressor) of toxin-antitoxin stability system
MCPMKSASIREVRREFSRILKWVANGEEVAITRGLETVARLVPVARKKGIRAKMPDVVARLQKVFGRKVISDNMMKQILDENRTNY